MAVEVYAGEEEMEKVNRKQGRKREVDNNVTTYLSLSGRGKGGFDV